MRANFHKRVEAIFQHLAESVRKENRFAGILKPVFGIQMRAVFAMTGHRRVQRRRRLAALNVRESFQHDAPDRVDVVTVVSDFDSNRAIENAACLQRLGDELQRLRITRERQHLRPVDCSDGNSVVPLNQCARLFLTQPDSQHPTLPRDRALRLRPVINHLDRLFQSQRSRREASRHFAD